jgi:HisJ family histidinol phosphate phosphatase
MDDYEKELDFIGGTLHEWIFGYPVTSKKKLLELLTKKKMKDVIDEYFETSESMINSKIFKNICHLDVIFRYINENDIKPEENCDTSEDRVLELGRLCIKNNISIEYNLSGRRFPIGRPFPSKAIISQLKKEGGKFYVGSDSHSLDYFKKQITKVKEAYNYIRSN